MGQLDINQAIEGGLSTAYSISQKSTDGVSEQKETEWFNTNWSRWYGYFLQYDQVRSAIMMKAIWNIGKGYTTDAETQVILENISGWGKDTFEDILFNMLVSAYIGGDSYAHIIIDEETNTLLNLKCLDPESIKHIVGSDGMLK